MFKISVSSLNMYDKCPKQYYYRYIEKVRMPRIRRDHLELGTVIHKALQYFHERWRDIKQDKYEIMSKCCIDAINKCKTPVWVWDDAKVILDDYLIKIPHPSQLLLGGTEWRFKTHLEDDVYLIGVIDRIDNISNRYHIVDYKTGKHDVTEDLQVKSYAYAISQQHKNIEYPITASLVMLKLHKTHKFEFYEKDLKDVSGIYMDKANTIKTEKEWVTKPSRLCFFCDYRDLCPDAQRSTRKGPIK